MFVAFRRIFFSTAYRSGQALKLLEFDARYSILRKGYRVIDLGSAPGGWAQVAVNQVGSLKESPSVFCIDEVSMEQLDGTYFIEGDFCDLDTRAQLLKAIRMSPVDVVLADIDFKRVIDYDTNSLRMKVFNDSTVDLCMKMLRPGGTLFMKTLKGAFEDESQQMFKRVFESVQVVHPTYNIREGDFQELYYLGQGFKLTQDYHKFPRFFQKHYEGDIGGLQDSELPPDIFNKEQTFLQTKEYLEQAHKLQFKVERQFYETVKNSPLFGQMDFSNLRLNLTDDPLTDEEREEIFLALTVGKYTFNRKQIESIDEIDKIMLEQRERLAELRKYRNNKDSMLLLDGEKLGDNKEMPEHLRDLELIIEAEEQTKNFKHDFKHLDENGKLKESEKARIGREMIEEEFLGENPDSVLKKLKAETEEIQQMRKERFDELMKNLDNFNDEKMTETITKYQNKKYEQRSERNTKLYKNKHFAKNTPFGRKN